MKLTEVKGIGGATEEKLSKLNVFDAEQLVEYLPKSYIDLQSPRPLRDYGDGDFVFVQGRVIESRLKKGRYGGGTLYVVCENEGLRFRLIYYNQPYYLSSFAVGEEYLLLGKLKIDGTEFYLNNPIFEKADKAKRLDGVFTVYATKGEIGQGALKNVVASAIDTVALNSLIDDELRSELGYPTLREVYRAAHFPKNMEQKCAAHRQLLLEDTATLITVYRAVCKDNAVRQNVFGCFDGIAKRFESALPYKLTRTQERAIEEIYSDMTGKTVMNRLLLGDVGSGKTVVAFAATYAASCNGYQSVLMAPTEILVKQHFENAVVIFGKLGKTVAQLYSSMSAEERNLIVRKLKSGEIDILIATQSVLNENVEFAKLGLVITDEQHRFGVRQRGTLERKGNQTDTLVMSATPIPRAILLTMFDELSVSLLENRYERTNVQTRLVSGERTEELWRYVLERAQKGERTFVVCPRKYDSEGIETYSAESLAKHFKKIAPDGVKIGLLHGGMKAEDKTAEIAAFAKGEINVLVSTTVIEVGIDVPDARNIVVMNSDRFGLATLHQLRGRVGRDGNEAYCFLQTERNEPESVARLSAMKSQNDGYKLAELDFEMRGGGDFLGTRQSGGSAIDSKYDEKLTVELLKEAKLLSDKILSSNRFSQNFAGFSADKWLNLIFNVTFN